MQKTGKRTPLMTRSGKERLGPLTLKQLTAKLESASGKKRDRYAKALARKIKLGVVYNAPQPAVEADDAEIRNN